VAGQRLGRQRGQGAVQQVGRGGQGLGQRVEMGLGGGQLLGVAHELEARVHRLAHHVGQVVQVERGQVAGPVLQAQGAEGPGQRVLALFGGVAVQGLEARAFGQEAAGVDAVGQRGVAPLQEGDHPGHGGAVGVELGQEVVDLRRALALRQGLRRRAQFVQAGGREQAQHQAQGQVFLLASRPRERRKPVR
jgi:hypothetical protein